MAGQTYLPWQVSLIRHLYPTNSTELLARVLGRSVKSVEEMAREMGLEKNKKNIYI